MYETNEEIWNAIVQLKGKTLYTLVENEPNHIIDVENTGSNSDQIIIENRNTSPIKEDVVAIYKLLFIKRILNRKTDLAYLELPEKQTSSIIFTIVRELTKNETIIKGERDIKLRLKK